MKAIDDLKTLKKTFKDEEKSIRDYAKNAIERHAKSILRVTDIQLEKTANAMAERLDSHTESLSNRTEQCMTEITNHFQKELDRQQSIYLPIILILTALNAGLLIVGIVYLLNTR